MESHIEEIKRKINIANFVGEYVPLKKAGRNYRGLCPFHGEKTSSFMVNEELGIYKCFGCGVGGDVIKFLMEIEGLEFGEAIRKLAEKAGVKLPEFKGEKSDEKKELLEIHHLTTEYYHFLLTKHKAGEVARRYLKERGINEKLIETFRLGFSLPEWEGLTEYLIKKKGYSPRVLVDGGLAIEGRGGVHDRFRGRIMFPLMDSSGKVVGFSGRILPEFARDEEPKYLNSPETAIYHKGRMLFGLSVARTFLKKKNRVVLVEGQMDMVSSYGAGVSETVACGGTALTVEQVEMLARLTPNLVLALDSDPAGEAAMKRSIEIAERRGMSIKMVQLKGGKDPDEIARKSPGEWRDMVEGAVPVYEFFFDLLIERYGAGEVEGIMKIVSEMTPLLANVENSVIREVWMRKLAERIGVDKQRVWEEIEKVRNRREFKEQPKSEVKVSKEVLFLGALIAAKPLMRAKFKKLFVGLPTTGAEGKLLALILDEEEEIVLKEWQKGLPSELSELAAEVVLSQPEEELTEKELNKLATEWGRRVVKEERDKVTEQIRKMEAEGESENSGLDNLMAKLVKLNAIEKRLVFP